MNDAPDPAEYLDLIDEYRSKFGEAPPVYWADPPEVMAENMDRMREAIDNGEPWSRPELENIPEGVLI